MRIIDLKQSLVTWILIPFTPGLKEVKGHSVAMCHA